MSSQVESLHQGFDFTLPQGHTARYVTDRTPSVFFPSGGSSYSPAQTRELQFTLSSFASFADLSTLMLKMTVRNTDAAHELVPRNGAGAAMIQSMTVKAAGRIVERITDYHRLHVMAETILLTKEKRKNVAYLCVGQGQDHAPDSGHMLGEAIAAHASRTVLFKPLQGILSMSKAYPLWAAPLQLIFTLADAEQSFIETVNPVDRSQSFVVEAPQILCSTMEVDSSLLESYRKHILSGGELTFELNSWSNISSAVTGPRFDLALNR